jgi:hypothetical protein
MIHRLLAYTQLHIDNFADFAKGCSGRVKYHNMPNPIMVLHQME